MKNMINNSFHQWREKILKNECKSIYPIKFGMIQEEIIAQFGEPNDVSVGIPPSIIKYEDIEFHFDKRNDYKLFLIYSDEEIDLVILFEPLLSRSLENVCDRLKNDNETYCNLFTEGHDIIANYKKNGGTRENAYNTIHFLYLKNREKNGELSEYKEDLIADWLDCICGNPGNKERLIRENRKFRVSAVCNSRHLP